MTSREKLESALAVLMFTTVATAPLVYLPATSDYYWHLTAPKNIVALVGALAVAVTLLAWARSMPAEMAVIDRRWRITLLVVAAALASTLLTGDDLRHGAGALRPYACMLSLFLAAALSPRARRAAALAVVVAGTATAATVLLEEWGIKLPGVGMDPSGLFLLPAGSMVHRNYAALLIVPALLLAFPAALAARRRSSFALLAATLAVCVAGLFATRARVSLFAAAIGLTVTLYWLRALARSAPGRVAIIGVAALAATTMRARAPMSEQHGSLTHKMEVTFSRTQDQSRSERLLIWSCALHEIADHPLIGVGGEWSGSPAARQHCEHPEVGRAHAHSLWLHVAAEFGLPVAVSFLAGALLLCAAVRRVVDLALARPDQVAAVGCAAAVVALLVASLFEPAHIPGVYSGIGAVAGLVVGQSHALAAGVA